MTPKSRSRVNRFVLALYSMVLIGAVAMAVHAQTGSQSENPRALFQQANQAYSAGDFAQARDLYEHLLSLAPRNPTVEYNLGNAYARLNDTGRAVVHYERALRTDPGLDDARENLHRLAPPSNNPEISPLIAPFRWVRRWMNVDQWLWTAFLLLLATCLAAALWSLGIKAPNVWKRIATVLLILFLFTTAFTASSIVDALRRDGVVLHDKTMARSGPGDNYVEAMELPAGTKVIAIGEPQQGWVKFHTPDGRVAYIQSADVEWIDRVTTE